VSDKDFSMRLLRHWKKDYGGGFTGTKDKAEGSKNKHAPMDEGDSVIFSYKMPSET